MKRISELTPEFVELMPPALEIGKLYVSVPYSLTAHLCACGCGEKVVLPLHPQQWRLTYDGATISIFPSVGNVGTPCNSHYWIKNGRVDWSYDLSPEQARRGFERDRRDLRGDSDSSRNPAVAVASPRIGFWHGVRRRLHMPTFSLRQRPGPGDRGAETRGRSE